MFAKVFSSEDDELTTHEIAGRLAVHIPVVCIDWPMGYRIVKDNVDQLVFEGVAKTWIDSHSSFLGKIAVVEAWFPEFRNREYSVRFQIGWCGSPIELTAEPVDDVFLEYAAEKIAAALGYRFKLCSEQDEMQ